MLGLDDGQGSFRTNGRFPKVRLNETHASIGRITLALIRAARTVTQACNAKLSYVRPSALMLGFQQTSSIPLPLPHRVQTRHAPGV